MLFFANNAQPPLLRKMFPSRMTEQSVFEPGFVLAYPSVFVLLYAVDLSLSYPVVLVLESPAWRRLRHLFIPAAAR